MGGAEKVKYRVQQWSKILGAVEGMLRNKRLSMKIKRGEHKSMIVPKLLYGTKM